MLMIHSFETLGLLNSQRNVEYRIQSPENVIKTYDMGNKSPKINLEKKTKSSQKN